MSDITTHSLREDVVVQTKRLSSNNYDYEGAIIMGVFVIAVIAAITTKILAGGLILPLVVALICGLVAAHLIRIMFLVPAALQEIRESLNPTESEEADLIRFVAKALLFPTGQKIKLLSKDVKKYTGYYNTMGKFEITSPESATHVQERWIVFEYFGYSEKTVTRPNANSIWEEAFKAAKDLDRNSLKMTKNHA